MARAKARQTGRRSERPIDQPADDAARETPASPPEEPKAAPRRTRRTARKTPAATTPATPAADAASTDEVAADDAKDSSTDTSSTEGGSTDASSAEGAASQAASGDDGSTDEESAGDTAPPEASGDDGSSNEEPAGDAAPPEASGEDGSTDEDRADDVAAQEASGEDGSGDDAAPEGVDEKSVSEDSATDETDTTEAGDVRDSDETAAADDTQHPGDVQDPDETPADGGVPGAGDVPEEEPGAKASPPLPTDPQAVALITALMRLREAVAGSHLPLDVAGADEARHRQRSMLDQLDDYVLPRLVQLEAPLLAVVGGSTGAGKSTLVNTLVGSLVSEPGVLRPTTRSPVLVHHPGDTDWFNGERILPGLVRSTSDGKPGGTDDPGSLRLIASDTIPQGLAILDAPDIDSVVESNRELAAQLLAAADLWLFVTTASRYADAVPWDFLKDAADRSTAVAIVLDRVPPGSEDDVTGHLAHMLLERGLGDSPMFAVPESELGDQGLLPDEAIGQIKTWLTALAADATARAAVVRRTLRGAVNAMTKKLPGFASAVRSQSDMVAELRKDAEAAYARAVTDIEEATQDGTMLRGEVLARWQEFVGTGELLRGLQTRVGRMRDKLKSSVSGRPQTTRELNEAVESGLEALLREHAEAAAERAESAWQASAPGRQLLAGGERDLGRASRTFTADAARAVRDWQGQVLDLVRREGADKRSTARILSYGVNGLGIALMIVVFASTAGIPTGAEVGVGAGTAVLGQKLLEAVFGDQAVRNLASKARKDLNARVRALMDAELARYLTLLDEHAVDPDAARRVTESARAVEDCL